MKSQKVQVSLDRWGRWSSEMLKDWQLSVDVLIKMCSTLKADSQCDGFRRWGLDLWLIMRVEPTNGINALRRYREHVLSAIWGYSICKPGSGFLPEPILPAFDLGLPASKTVRNKYMFVVQTTSSVVICYCSLNWLRQRVFVENPFLFVWF